MHQTVARPNAAGAHAESIATPRKNHRKPWPTPTQKPIHEAAPNMDPGHVGPGYDLPAHIGWII